MTAGTGFAARRATVDDLPQLISLWQLEQLDAAALEKRFKEFQVVSDDAGVVLAALGVQLQGTQGLLHSEAIARPEIADQLRELLWQRLQVLIQNNALERLWLQIPVPFWREREFVPATPEQLVERPAAFAGNGREWLVCTLRAAAANAALEQEFVHLRAMQQQEQARLRRQVVMAKRVALGITVLVFVLVVIWALTMMNVGPKLWRR